MILHLSHCLFFFFFNDTATTEIYTLSLHDALPISFSFNALSTQPRSTVPASICFIEAVSFSRIAFAEADRKSTRLNSSHGYISYAVFCLKKKKKKPIRRPTRLAQQTTDRAIASRQI